MSDLVEKESVTEEARQEDKFDFENLDFDDDMQRMVDNPDLDSLLSDTPPAEAEAMMATATPTAQAQEAAPIAKPKGGVNPAIAVAVVVALLLLGGIGFFAMKVLKLGNGASVPPSVPMAGEVDGVPQATLDALLGSEPQQVNQTVQPVASEPVASPSAVTPERAMIDAALASNDQAALPSVDTAVGADSALVVSYKPDEVIEQAETSGFQAPKITANSEVSREEELYDNLLSSASTLDVPPEAIQIDQSVVKKKLEAERLNAMESEVASARESIKMMQGQVTAIRGEVGNFARLMEMSAKQQAELSKSVDALSQSVKASAQQQEKELKSLRDAVEGAQKQASRAVAEAAKAKKEASQREVVVKKEVREVVVQAPVKASPPAVKPVPVQAVAAAPAKVMPKPLPAPKAVVAPSAPSSTASVPAQCDGRTISSVWRVKGVINSAAYIVQEGGRGLYVGKGAVVPGFGQVQSFNPDSRTVCTTSGLIRR